MRSKTRQPFLVIGAEIVYNKKRSKAGAEKQRMEA